MIHQLYSVLFQYFPSRAIQGHPGSLFTFSVFLVLCNRLAAVIFAVFMAQAKGENMKNQAAPLFFFILGFPESWGYPEIIHFRFGFSMKRNHTGSLGYPHLWKPPMEMPETEMEVKRMGKSDRNGGFKWCSWKSLKQKRRFLVLKIIVGQSMGASFNRGTIGCFQEATGRKESEGGRRYDLMSH